MRRNIRQISVKIVTIVFLIAMTFVSFEKEKSDIQAGSGQVNAGYLDGVFEAEIVSNTSPEIVKHTESYQIQIIVKNCGTATWSENEKIRLCIWQDDFDYGFRVHIPDGVEVLSGEQWTFELNDFVLPEASQTRLEFQMVKEEVAYFGEREAVIITAVD